MSWTLLLGKTYRCGCGDCSSHLLYFWHIFRAYCSFSDLNRPLSAVWRVVDASAIELSGSMLLIGAPVKVTGVVEVSIVVCPVVVQTFGTEKAVGNVAKGINTPREPTTNLLSHSS